MMLKKEHYLGSSIFPYAVLSAIACIQLWMFWPGEMTPDSQAQYQAAITGVFSDHHPPIMALWWRFLNHLYPGSGLLFLFHMALLYSALSIFIYTFKRSAWRWLYAFFPLIPTVAFYAFLIWKDVSFTFSYLLVMAILSYYMLEKKKPSIWVFCSMLLLLFYGSAVKFQAIYILPIALFGLSWIMTQFKVNISTWLYSIIFYGLMVSSIYALNNALVPESNKDHSWQLVKIYDLAAISVYTNQPLFPEFIKRDPNFSMEKIKKIFNHKKVDDLNFPIDAPLRRKGRNAEERKEILDQWYVEIKKYPHIYLWHRLCNWTNMLIDAPFPNIQSVGFHKYKTLHWLGDLRDTINDNSQSSHSAKYYVGKIIFGLYSILWNSGRFIFVFPILVVYLYFSMKSLSVAREAKPLFLMMTSSFFLLLVLFFFSMAGVARYVYLATCMLHCSHAFAYQCWQRVREHKLHAI